MFTVASLAITPRTSAQAEKILYNFGSKSKDATVPSSPLTSDPDGNLYGTSVFGGPDNVGTVYELVKGGGGYKEKILYRFSKVGGGGQSPFAGLIFDAAGNLYGTATAGGTDNVGTVFELSPPTLPNTQWTETILHSFSNNFIDGQTPQGLLIFDGSGNLYGVTAAGGSNAAGTAYELSPAGGGAWTETILYTFSTDTGSYPNGGMIFDASGNLYGVAAFGGSAFDGVVFELSPAGGGSWNYTVLHTFTNGTDGYLPEGELIFDSAGNLYGITANGNPTDNGTVFELSLSSDGTWTEEILHNFESSTDGANPNGTLVFNSAGVLFGETLGGGTGTCQETQTCGIVFELRLADGVWHEKILHDFNKNGTDGFLPTSGVTLDSAGNLIGTTEYGGSFDEGTVFVIAH
jgi:uncharacterized repeat protein (TIGR03803 family)